MLDCLSSPLRKEVRLTALLFTLVMLLCLLPWTVTAQSGNSADPNVALARHKVEVPVGAIPASPGPIAWGPVVDGMQAGVCLATPRTAFAPGEPIWQEVYLRNRSAAVVAVQAIGGYEEQGAPVITTAKGVSIKVLRYFGMGLMFTVTTHVRPGEIGLVGRFAVAFQAPDSGQERPHEVAPGLSSSAEGMPLALAGPGTYILRQELAPMAADEKTLRKPLSTGTLKIQIAGAPKAVVPVDHNQIVDLSHAPIAWGPERSGFVAGLLYVGSTSHYFVGERVRLAVVLRNISKKTLSFWHETSFASLEPPDILDASGKRWTMRPALESEWKTLSEIRMTGVTYDMTFAPSADGPSSLRQSEIQPGQSVLGYYLTAFVIPPKWSDSRATPGRYHVVQPMRVRIGGTQEPDTVLETGGLELEIHDPDAPAPPP